MDAFARCRRATHRSRPRAQQRSPLTRPMPPAASCFAAEEVPARRPAAHRRLLARNGRARPPVRVGGSLVLALQVPIPWRTGHSARSGAVQPGLPERRIRRGKRGIRFACSPIHSLKPRVPRKGIDGAGTILTMGCRKWRQGSSFSKRATWKDSKRTEGGEIWKGNIRAWARWFVRRAACCVR
jgi:hypothetical protein